MLSTRYLSRFSQSERLAFHRQWLRSGQCVRCFHASISRRAEKEDASTPQNAPRRGPTRQQRAAMISEEVKMIQRDHPAPTFSEPDPDTLRPPGDGQTVDPEVLGENVAPGRMGANDIPTQEGPTAQGVGRVVDSSEDAVADTSKLARGARSPHDSVTEPTEGETSVLNATSGSKESKESSPSSGRKNTDSAENPAQKDLAVQPLSTIAQFRQELASGKYSTSTIAGGRFESVMNTQANQAIRRGKAGHRTTKNRTEIPTIQKVVAGKHDPNNYLSGSKFGSNVLSEVAKATTMNGTYMSNDTRKFLRRIEQLLPPAARAQGAQAK